MKTNNLFFGLILLAVGCNTQPQFGWYTGTFEEAQVQAGDKLIMVDVMTEW